MTIYRKVKSLELIFEPKYRSVTLGGCDCRGYFMKFAGNVNTGTKFHKPVNQKILPDKFYFAMQTNEWAQATYSASPI